MSGQHTLSENLRFLRTYPVILLPETEPAMKALIGEKERNGSHYLSDGSVPLCAKS